MVVGIIALVDRQEGGAETIRAAGLPLVTLATRADFTGAERSRRPTKTIVPFHGGQ